MRQKSAGAFTEACKVIPGGVNSPARAFAAVGGGPPFIARGLGSRIVDLDGNEYIDYVCSWGPLIFGHAHPRVLGAITETSSAGTSFGAPTQLETLLALQIVKMVPSVEMVRLVSSGTEATMSAVRVARGFTGREKVIKFEGGWHGHGDTFLIKAGSSALTLGVPDSPGIPSGVAAATITVPYNNAEAVGDVVAKNPGEIAAVIVEPVAGNMGTVPPREGFLEALREITADDGSILIFDEVITGFRVSPGGAQELYGILPDLTCMGKILGGGLPMGAYGGRADIMSEVAPLGRQISQAGTLSGNPLAVAAGLTQLQMLTEPGLYERLNFVAETLADGMRENLDRLDIPFRINRVGAMLSMFFTSSAVVDYTTALSADIGLFRRYFWEMIDRGIYLAPSQFECMLPSLAHTEKDVETTLKAHYDSLCALAK